MSNFNIAVQLVLQNEGGLSQDPDDSGGTTNFGISFRFLKSINVDAIEDDIIHMTQQQAIDIYKKYFWDIGHFDKIINQKVCSYIFDCAVNMGAAPTWKITQRASWAIMGYMHPLDDSLCGNETLDIINQCGSLLLAPLRAERANHYRGIADKNPNDIKFLNDWLKRAYR